MGNPESFDHLTLFIGQHGRTALNVVEPDKYVCATLDSSRQCSYWPYRWTFLGVTRKQSTLREEHRVCKMTDF